MADLLTRLIDVLNELDAEATSRHQCSDNYLAYVQLGLLRKASVSYSELSAAVASGARLVMPPVVHFWATPVRAWCGTPFLDSPCGAYTHVRESVTCPDCKRLLEPRIEAAIERHADPEDAPKCQHWLRDEPLCTTLTTGRWGR